MRAPDISVSFAGLRVLLNYGNPDYQGATETKAMSVELKVLDILARQFASSFTRNTPLTGDSLDAVEVHLELERAFNISIPDDLPHSNYATAGALIDYLKKRTGQK